MSAWIGTAGTARRGMVARPAPRRVLDWISALLGVASILWWSSVVMLDPRGDEKAGEPSAHAPGTVDLGAPATVFGGYVGYPYTHPSNLHFVQPGATDLTVHDVAWEGRPFKSPIYYGLRATRWTGGGSPFGRMIDFTHSKAIAIPQQSVRFTGTRDGRTLPETARINETFKHLEFSHGHNMLTANGVMRLGPVSRQLSPYVGLGFGANLPHTEIQFIGDAARTYEYQYTGPTGQALLGLEIRLARASLFVEYKLTISHYDAPLSGRDNKASFGYSDFLVQLVAWWRGEKPRYGSVRTWLVSHQVIGGVGGVRSHPVGAQP